MFEASSAVDWPFAGLVWRNKIGVSVFLRRSTKGNMPAFGRQAGILTGPGGAEADVAGFVSIGDRRLFNKMVRGADRVRTVRTIDADPALSFAHSPLERVQKYSDGEPDEETRENDVKALGLLRREFCCDCIAVVRHSRVVVVDNTSGHLLGVTLKMSHQRNTFSSNALRPRVVRGWKTARRAKARRCLKRAESFLPIPRSIGIFARHPSDHIAVNEIEPKQSATKKACARLIDLDGLGGARTGSPKARDGVQGGVNSLIRISECSRARPVANKTVGWK